MKTIAQIYEALNKGDPLTDEELAAGLAHFQNLEKAIRGSGAAFAITSREVTRVVHEMENFVWARQHR